MSGGIDDFLNDGNHQCFCNSVNVILSVMTVTREQSTERTFYHVELITIRARYKEKRFYFCQRI